MADNVNIPDLSAMLEVTFNPQQLYDLLLSMSNDIAELKDKVKELQDDS